MPRVILVLVVIGLIVYALVEAWTVDGDRIRLMPRWTWFFAILLVPGVGALAWLVFGRPLDRPGGGGGGQRRPIAPDDDPDFLRRL